MPKSDLPMVPWVETEMLEAHLQRSGADEISKGLARSLSETGVAIMDFSDEIPLFEAASRDVETFFENGSRRVQDAWRRSPAIRRLAIHPRLKAFLSLAYGREPFAFQTLNFKRGSEQDFHSDAHHFHSVPERFMCGAWFALEDVAPGAGPLVYHKGSHRLPVLTHDDIADRLGPGASVEGTFASALSSQLSAFETPAERATLSKGQVLIWAANLAHGGAPITDASSTRRSLVTHYFFENCLYHTPVRSLAGELVLRLPPNITTGGWVWPRDRGRCAPLPLRLLAQSAAQRLINKPLQFS